MKPRQQPPFVELTVLLFAVWQSQDLLNAWQHSPHDRFGWIALLVWLTPLVARLTGGSIASAKANPFLLGGAIFAGALSSLTELHFFGHIALALALAGWLKISWRKLIWVATALAWMPALGWLLADLSSPIIITLRLTIALAGAICIWPKLKTANEA